MDILLFPSNYPVVRIGGENHVPKVDTETRLAHSETADVRPCARQSGRLPDVRDIGLRSTRTGAQLRPHSGSFLSGDVTSPYIDHSGETEKSGLSAARSIEASAESYKDLPGLFFALPSDPVAAGCSLTIWKSPDAGRQFEARALRV